MPRKILLWDIDGTAISMPPGKADKHLAAVSAVLQLEHTRHSTWAGMTDGHIVTEMAALAGVRLSETQFRDILAVLERLTVEELRSAPATLAPGVSAALQTCRDDGWVQGLLTGNTPRRARTKLTSVGIENLVDWDIGYFGDSPATRNQLALAAITDLRESFSGPNIVVIGDTPRDIAAARHAGVAAVAVASGNYSAVELASHDPALVISGLDKGLEELLHFLAANDSQYLNGPSAAVTNPDPRASSR